MNLTEGFTASSVFPINYSLCYSVNKFKVWYFTHPVEFWIVPKIVWSLPLRQNYRHFFFFFCLIYLRARYQIPVLGLTGLALGKWVVAPGVGFSTQNLRIKYIPCVGTHLWITMPAKSTLCSIKSTCVINIDK